LIARPEQDDLAAACPVHDGGIGKAAIEHLLAEPGARQDGAVAIEDHRFGQAAGVR